MRRGQTLPDDQAEIVFTDKFLEQLNGYRPPQQEEVLSTAVRLCSQPWGKHPLSSRLAGWNTADVLERKNRLVFKASVVGSTGLIEVLCIGPRSNNEIYDMAVALVESGALSPEDVTNLWNALVILDIIAERVGLDGWDFRPPPAPEGMQKAAVAAGLLTPEQARLLSRDEIEAAMEVGWAGGAANPAAALVAALERARTRAIPMPDPNVVLAQRSSDRCGVLLPRAQRTCSRRNGHPGPHR